MFTWLSLTNKVNPRILCLHEIQVTVICSRTSLVGVMSESCIKRVICKTWTGLSAGALANSADPDQMPQNEASDQDHGLHCLHNYSNLRVEWNSLKSPFRSIFPNLHSETVDQLVLSVLWLFQKFWISQQHLITEHLVLWVICYRSLLTYDPSPIP